jgi:hypothetical protein
VAGGAAAGAGEQRDEWSPYRQQLQDSYVAGCARRAAKAQQAAKQTGKDVEDAAVFSQCASCGCEQLRVEKRVTVTCVRWQHAVRAVVPVYMCTQCKATFCAQPVDIGYLPGSPIHVNLASASDKAQPVWFDLGLLAAAYELQHHDGAKPLLKLVQSAAATLRGRTLLGCVLRRRLLASAAGRSVRQFAYLRCHVEDLANLGVEGWPNCGLVAQCGGCWKGAGGVSLQDTHFDCCLNFSHLQREGAGWRWVGVLQGARVV